MSIVRKSDRTYLRAGKAAEELGLHPITIRRWMKMGKIQAVRVGIEARIPRSEIARLLGKTEERLSSWAKTGRPGREMLVLSAIGSGLNSGRKRLRASAQVGLLANGMACAYTSKRSC